MQAAVDELGRSAEPGDRLLVGPSDLRRTWYSDVFIYWLFPELEPATYYIEMDPGLANAEGSSLADDVASADWVILTGLWDGWMEPNSSMEYGSDAAEPGPRATTSAWSATTRTARPCSTSAAADAVAPADLGADLAGRRIASLVSQAYSGRRRQTGRAGGGTR